MRYSDPFLATFDTEQTLTNLQTLIRKLVAQNGAHSIRVGRGSPANAHTINALRRAGYECRPVGCEGLCTIYRITKE